MTLQQAPQWHPTPASRSRTKPSEPAIGHMRTVFGKRAPIPSPWKPIFRTSCRSGRRLTSDQAMHVHRLRPRCTLSDISALYSCAALAARGTTGSHPVYRLGRPGSRSKYAGSLPDRGTALVDPRIGIDPFAQFRVLTRLHAYPFGRILVRVGRIASVVHIDRAGTRSSGYAMSAASKPGDGLPA